HLGKKIKEIETYRGTQAFLDWLRNQIYEQQVDCLIVAGDIFDTTTPTNQAKEQYYRFIGSLVGSPCRSVVVIAGNHDSPSLITAPKEVLKYLNVHVVGTASPTLENEVLEVQDENGNLGGIIGVVPFIRERDIYRSREEDAATERAPLVTDAIRNHYHNVYEEAAGRRGDRHIPIVLTGHLFAAGTYVADDEEREGYIVGNLGQQPLDVFPKEADYVALGHIHRPQSLGHDDTRNYSGSPYQMNFKEVGQKKYVRIIEFPDGQVSVTSVELPQFLRLEQLEGDANFIIERIKELAREDEEIYLKVVLDGEVIAKNATIEAIKEATKNTKIYVIKFEQKINGVTLVANESGDEFSMEMTPKNVFEKLLNERDITGQKREVLEGLYKRVVDAIEQNNQEEFLVSDLD
ncbi:MAG: exonuclease subunit SbcD, partial [Burkholderiales bacterium]|nr:exonuclease subunit SbcD [Burkholderiales bacterium]